MFMAPEAIAELARTRASQSMTRAPSPPGSSSAIGSPDKGTARGAAAGQGAAKPAATRTARSIWTVRKRAMVASPEL